ncbi:anthrax toxin lethal factor-related metalloendopeptidase [Blautia difficilis]|uniref:anthrax toxin lethal factor-related metalloendopeptidase n=1 Tax=Blautia difficilis TaxID=2763027 RepID=UPI0002FCE8A7|nr:hypothetical protein [Blautia difficilis]
MKKRITELLKKRRVAAGLTAIVLAVAVGSVAVVQQKSQIPELPVYTDPEMETNIEEEETPLADKPVVKTTTSKKTTTKKVKMKKAAAKTYTKELPATSTTSKKTAQTSSASVVTKTTVVKKIEEKYTKKSKVKVVTTVATTTVTTTTTAKAGASTGVNSATTANNNSGVTGTVEVGQLAPKEDSRVLTAYRTLGFKVNVDPSVSYSGYFNARNRQITLKKVNETIYHELGHFIAFIAGNVDTTSEFKTIYNQEKSLYTAYNKAYVTQNSSEYFAESAKEYVLNPGALKAARPKTYEAVRSAVESITDERIAKIQKYYGAIWK